MKNLKANIALAFGYWMVYCGIAQGGAFALSPWAVFQTGTGGDPNVNNNGAGKSSPIPGNPGATVPYNPNGGTTGPNGLTPVDPVTGQNPVSA